MTLDAKLFKLDWQTNSNSIGETLAEIKSNIREAIIGYLEALAAMNQAIPAPQDDSVYLETVGVSF